MDAGDLVEYPLDLTIGIRRDVEEGRTGNGVEKSNLNGWTGGDTVNPGKENWMKGQALVFYFHSNNLHTLTVFKATQFIILQFWR